VLLSLRCSVLTGNLKSDPSNFQILNDFRRCTRVAHHDPLYFKFALYNASLFQQTARTFRTACLIID